MRVLLSIVLLVLRFLARTEADNDEYALVRRLMDNYENAVRPAAEFNHVLKVNFGVALAQIIDVDEKNQVITTNCWLNQAWIDNKLKWNASDYGNITVVRIPAEKIWKPDIILYNNADPLARVTQISTNAIVMNTGNVSWLSTVIFKSSCTINVRFFPFDEQNCSIKFASWTYDGFQLDLIKVSDEGDLSNFVPNGEWQLMAFYVERHVVYYSCCEEPYPDITYTIQIKRRPLFYVFNMILPCALITGVALLGFYVPSESGEKITMGITTLLSMTVFLMLVAESMPPTSDVLPLIGLYYGITIGIVSAATAMTVFTLNVHHKGARGKRVHPLLKRFCLNFLARILCVTVIREPKAERCTLWPPYCPSDCEHTEQRHRNDPLIEKAQSFELYEKLVLSSSRGQENGRLGQPARPEPGDSPRFRTARMAQHCRSCTNVGIVVNDHGDEFERQFAKVLLKVNQTIERNEQRLAEQDRRELIKVEWQQVASVLDRLLLWIFVCGTAGISCSIFLESPHALHW